MSKQHRKSRNSQPVAASQVTQRPTRPASVAIPQRRRAQTPRVPRGVRMSPEVWAWVDYQAAVHTGGNASAMLEKLVREDMAA